MGSGECGECGRCGKKLLEWLRNQILVLIYTENLSTTYKAFSLPPNELVYTHPYPERVSRPKNKIEPEIQFPSSLAVNQRCRRVSHRRRLVNPKEEGLGVGSYDTAENLPTCVYTIATELG